MIRKSLLVAAMAGASSIALLGGQAGALSSSSLVPAIVLPDTSLSLQLSGTCTPEYANAGVGSTGGLQYYVEGAGASSSTNTVATQVECKFFDLYTDSDLVVFQSGYKSGPAASLAQSYVVRTFDEFVTCIKVDRFDSNGQITSTPWIATNGTYCG